MSDTVIKPPEGRNNHPSVQITRTLECTCATHRREVAAPLSLHRADTHKKGTWTVSHQESLCEAAWEK